MTYKQITVVESYDGQVVEISLGPAPGNIISTDLMEELSTELRELQSDSLQNVGRKLIVISGQGEHFSYGASVEEHRREEVGDMLPRFHSLIRQVLASRIPTMAKVSGMCLGGGFELALACSMIFCAEDAKFGAPEIRLGVFPPAASVLLPCKTGESIACEMILTGDTYPAGDVLRIGIVNKVAEVGGLDSLVSGFIRKQILPKSASSLRIACRASRVRIVEYYDAHIDEAEKLYLETLMSTADAEEGIDAFLEKRQPNWSDK